MPEYVYHYTGLACINGILDKGHLVLTPSNLIEPKDAKRGFNPITGRMGVISEMSDSVHPVVWLADDGDVKPATSESHGLQAGKAVIRCKIPMRDDYYWWSQWADKYRMKTSWRKRFTRDCRYSSWYVSEHEIPLEDIEVIENLETGEIYWDKSSGTKNYYQGTDAVQRTSFTNSLVGFAGLKKI